MYFQIVEINPAPVVVSDPDHRIQECDAMTVVGTGYKSFDEATLALHAYNREDVDFTVYAIVVTMFNFPIRSPF